MDDKRLDTIKKLFPALTDEEAEEARLALQRYVAFLRRMVESIQADPERRAQLENELTKIRAEKNHNSDTPPGGGVCEDAMTGDPKTS